MSTHVAGDILRTHADEVVEALAGFHEVRKKSDDEVRLRSTSMSFEIYAQHGSVGERRDYLVSGSIEGTLTDARAVVEEIARRLGACGLTYRFELNDEDDWDQGAVITSDKSPSQSRV